MSMERESVLREAVEALRHERTATEGTRVPHLSVHEDSMYGQGWLDAASFIENYLIAGAVCTSDEHKLRCLVAESLEVFATTFVLLTEDDPPRVDLAANEVQQAHRRISEAVTSS